MNQKYVIGNWKLNPASTDELDILIHELNAADALSGVQMAICPSFVHLSCVKDKLAPLFLVGAQDIAHKTDGTGAFTGDVSARQVLDLGASFSLIGHSERRQYHQETDVILSQKIVHALESGLSVVFCVGETKEDYEQKRTEYVLKSQLHALSAFGGSSLDNDTLGDHSFDTKLPRLIIAYEPVWAIGTGLTPTFDEIQSVHKFIAEQLRAMQIHAPILYGGSVNDKNASEFASSSLIDGVLVGGASLKADSFLTIARAFAGG